MHPTTPPPRRTCAAVAISPATRDAPPDQPMGVPPPGRLRGHACCRQQLPARHRPRAALARPSSGNRPGAAQNVSPVSVVPGARGGESRGWLLVRHDRRYRTCPNLSLRDGHERSWLRQWPHALACLHTSAAELAGIAPFHRLERVDPFHRLNRVDPVDRIRRLDLVDRLGRLVRLRALGLFVRQRRLGSVGPVPLVLPRLAVTGPAMSSPGVFADLAAQRACWHPVAFASEVDRPTGPRRPARRAAGGLARGRPARRG